MSTTTGPFSAHFSADFGEGWTSLPATSLLHATITGLKPATAYDIRVIAFNSVGMALTPVAVAGTP